MKDGIQKVLGKKISGVIVAQKNESPRKQLFIIFSDDTHLELWGDQFTCASGLDNGGIAEAVSYAKSIGAEVTRIYLENSSSTVPENDYSWKLGETPK